MNKGEQQRELIRQGDSFYSTILAFDLEERHLSVIHEAIKNIRVWDKLKKMTTEIKVCEADDHSSIYSTPFFVAFINFKNLMGNEKKKVIDYFLDEERTRLKETLERDGIIEDLLEDIPREIIYTFNLAFGNDEILPESFINGENIVKDREILRLKLLNIAKELEGKGRANDNSGKIYRILLMYKFLKENGYLSSEVVRTLNYPDNVSDRTYYKDMEILKNIEAENLFYDHKMKVYRLKS